MVIYDIMARDQILRNSESMQLAHQNLTEGAPVSCLRLVFGGEACNKSQRADETGSGRCNICPLRLIVNFTQNTKLEQS